jgi:hypothetical protein
MRYAAIRVHLDMRFVALCLLIVCTCAAKAQSGFIRAGIQTGIASVGLKGDPNLDIFLERDLRPLIGPGIWVPMKNNRAFRAQLLYCQKGAKGVLPLFNEDGDPLGFFQTDIRFNYLSLPLLFEKAWGKRLQFCIGIGTYLGLMLNQRTEYNDLISGESFSDNSTAPYVPWDGGLVLGTGLRFNAGKRIHFCLDMRGEWGVANVASKPVLFSQIVRQSANQVMLGFYYAPSKRAGQTRGLW